MGADMNDTTKLLPAMIGVMFACCSASVGAGQHAGDYGSGAHLRQNAQLDYWAFLTYDPKAAMSIGLQLYLSSPLKAKVQFCVI